MKNEIENFRAVLIGICILILVLAVLGASYFILKSDKTKDSEGKSENQIIIEKDSLGLDLKLDQPLPTRFEKLTPSDQFAKIFFGGENIATNTPTYNFKYEFDPNLLNQNVPEKFSFLKKVYAQTNATCSTLKASERLPVYLLSRNLSVSDATKIAKNFSIDSSAYASPNRSDPKQNDYFFTNILKKNLPEYLLVEKKNGYFSLHNPPSTIQPTQRVAYLQSWHNSLKNIFPNISQFPTINSNDDLETINLQNELAHPLIGPASMAEFELLRDICALPLDKSINNLSLEFVNSKLQNIHSKQRIILEQKMFTTQDAITAVRTSGNNSLITPEIFGVPPKKNAIVKIDKVRLVYADFGIEQPQCLYVPLYLVEGSTAGGDGSNSKVISAFSAIDPQNLLNLCVSEKTSDASASAKLIGNPDEKALKFDTFRLKEASEEALAKFDNKNGTCTGNQVDYVVTCRSKSNRSSSFNGNIFCSQFFAVNIENNLAKTDPFGVCQQACQTNILPKVYSRKISNFASLCSSTYWDDISSQLQDNPNSQTKGKPLPPRPTPIGNTAQPNYKDVSSDVECSLTVCPC